MDPENVETQEQTDFDNHDQDDTQIDEEILIANSDGAEKCVPVEGCLIGVTKKSLDDMFDLYNQHAHAIGFSIRKSTTRKSTQVLDLVVGKNYVCSCSGTKLNKQESLTVDGRKRKNIWVTRTGCEAKMRVLLNSDGVFEVKVHDMVHSHQLTRPELSYLHRSSRMISQPTKEAIQIMKSSGLKPTQSFRYMAEEAGGKEHVGHTLRDHMNLINRWRIEDIEGGDAINLIEKLDERGAAEDRFFYRVNLDESGRLRHIFWRDTMMREDFDLLGDIVVFDTTYSTNKYNLICAPFTGLNHHWKNVMYSFAFISDEKIETFEWLFNTFKKSLSGKAPISIFTDQDLAMSTALEKALPETRHRLCIWHLLQNAASRFSKLKSDQDFKDLFNKCLTGCVNKEDFEIFWEHMVSKYNLKNNSWLDRLYGLKDKWCKGLSKDFFSAGILSSQRSESTNNAISFKAKRTTNLLEFYGLFVEIVNEWRYKEQQDEFQCSRVIPESTLPMKGMLKHAAEVYTLTTFKKFEVEFREAISYDSKIIHTEDTLMVYEVKSDDSSYAYTVVFDLYQNLITCTCKKYEECWILCSHCLRVLHVNSVNRIPSSYIHKRWTKEAKVQVWDKFHSGTEETSALKDSIPWRHQIQRSMSNLVLKSHDVVEGRKWVEERVEKMEMGLSGLLESLKIQEQSIDVSNSASNEVLDPKCSITKGRKQRKKGHFERKNKKIKASSSSSIFSREIGTKTPIPRLI